MLLGTCTLFVWLAVAGRACCVLTSHAGPASALLASGSHARWLFRKPSKPNLFPVAIIQVDMVSVSNKCVTRSFLCKPTMINMQTSIARLTQWLVMLRQAAAMQVLDAIAAAHTTIFVWEAKQKLQEWGADTAADKHPHADDILEAASSVCPHGLLQGCTFRGATLMFVRSIPNKQL